MQIVSLGDNLHEMSKPIFWGKVRKFVNVTSANLHREWYRLNAIYFIPTYWSAWCQTDTMMAICSRLDLKAMGKIVADNILFFYYRIRSNYRTYPYKCTLMKFRSLQITASVHFIYFFIKAYVVGSHLNCIDLSMQFKWVPTTIAFIKKIRKKSHNNHQISPFLIFL